MLGNHDFEPHEKVVAGAVDSPYSFKNFHRAGNLIFALSLVVAVFVAYQPAWHAGFIWDDDDHLTANPCVVGPLGLKEIWTTSAARICPLVQTTFWLEHKIWGLSPLPYHLFNILMHAACALVLWQVLRRLNVLGAGLGAALWALHPVQVESAAWITELKNTQSGFFYLLTILFFAHSIIADQQHRPVRRWYFLSILCGALAIASKSSTTVLPLVLGLIVWWLERRWQWRHAWKLVPFLVLSVASSTLSIWTQQMDIQADVEWQRSWLERIAVAGNVVWFYIGKLVWPHPLIFIYPRWNVDTTHLVSYIPSMAVAIMLIIFWIGRRSWGRIGWFAFAYFVVALLPVLGLINHYFIRYSFVGDHFQYLASMGILALMGAGCVRLLIYLRLWMKPAGHILCLVILFILASLTRLQSRMYFNNETLYRTTINQNYNCAFAHNNLGLILAERGKIDDAIHEYLEAIRIQPNNAEAHTNVGWVLANRGQVNEAIEHYQKAIQIKPGYALAHNNFGLALQTLSKINEAIVEYKTAININPEDAVAHNNLGNALASLKLINEAIAEYKTALKIDPKYALAYNNLGVALDGCGMIDEAIEQYQKALNIQSDFALAHNSMGVALARRGQFDEAIEHYMKALNSLPDYPLAQDNLRLALVRREELLNLLARRREAIRLRPDDTDLLNDTAWLLASNPNASIRNGQEAVELAQRALQLSHGENPAVLDTLAAAYAETGRFSEAVQTARKALDLARQGNQTALAESLQARLRLYQAGKSYRKLLQPSAPSSPTH